MRMITMDIFDIIKTIQKDWAIIVAVFAFGGFWWQGKAWFEKMSKTLDSVGKVHDGQNEIMAEQNSMLDKILFKTENLEIRTSKIEESVEEIHDKVHEQEIKLAVLETSHNRARTGKM